MARVAREIIELSKGQVLSRSGLAGWQVNSCGGGRVWLTLEGHSQDLCLAAGRRLTVPDDGLLVVEAESAACLAFEPPAVAMAAAVAAPFPARLLARLVALRPAHS